MKFKLSIWIGIALLVGGIILARSQRGENMDSNELRVAFPYNHAAKFYEPTRIHLAPEYIFLENTFSPLVELDPENGKVVAGVAEDWSWDGDFLRLKIRKNLKTIDGTIITAKDAEFSLKRAMVRSGNTHGNFKDLVCASSMVKAVTDPCEGITTDGETLILKIQGRSQFILPMLSGIDFAVIPKSSTDPQTLDIIDYRNTSGPYFVSKDSETGHIELSINPNHFHFSKQIAQKIILVPTDPKQKDISLKLFSENKVDMITTIDAARPEVVINLNKSKKGSVLHKTANIRTMALFFTERGLKELSLDERLYLSQKVREALTPHFSQLPGYEATYQFFPSFGDGAIDQDKAHKISERKTLTEILNKKLSITTVRIGDNSIFKDKIETQLPFVEVSEGQNVPAFSKYDSMESMPHAYIGGPDTGFNEDISLISYSLISGALGLPKAEVPGWLEKYMALPEKKDRMKMLQAVHQEALEKITLYPLFSCPYTALIQNGWNSKLPLIFANNPLWLITKD